MPLYAVIRQLITSAIESCHQGSGIIKNKLCGYFQDRHNGGKCRDKNVNLPRNCLNKESELRIWIKAMEDEWKFSSFQLALTEILNLSKHPPPSPMIHHHHWVISSLSAPWLLSQFNWASSQCLVNSRYSCNLLLLLQRSCYRVDAWLASCFVGFLLTWQKFNAFKRSYLGKKKKRKERKHIKEHLCSSDTVLFRILLSLIIRAWQQPKPTAWLMKPKKAKKQT